jgi:hypothetical protein
MMSNEEFRQSLVRLKLSPTEAAQLLSVTPRTVHRWLEEEEVSGPHEQAVRAWIRLHNQHLAWRPDSVSIIQNDQDQITRHRLHVVNLDSILACVEQRGGPRVPWDVDWSQGNATLGPVEVGFYKLQSGSFSLSTYRRKDGDADVDRDAEIIEDAMYCIAQAHKKHNPDFGPVALVVHDGPAKGRVAKQRIEDFKTLKDAIDRVCSNNESPDFYAPFIMTKTPSEVLLDTHDLKRICAQRTAVPRALSAVAAYVRENSWAFVRARRVMPGPTDVAQRREQIEGLADKLDTLASKARRSLVSYQEFDMLLGALHGVGFFPRGDLISEVARAMVQQKL